MKFQLILTFAIALSLTISCTNNLKEGINQNNSLNGFYKGEYLDYVAFPIGGIGAGMVCMEGSGAISHVSVYNAPDIFNEPNMFAAISIKGLKNGAKVLQGPIPAHKTFGNKNSGRGDPLKNYGLPRFENAEFETGFPFGKISLHDDDIPLDVDIIGWSPFIPLDPDNSSLPGGAMEYTFKNSGNVEIEALFSFNTVNFMKRAGCKNSINPFKNGFILCNQPEGQERHLQGEFAFFTDDTTTVVDHCWFRGERIEYDARATTWKHIEDLNPRVSEPVEMDAPGASLYTPFRIKPGEKKNIKLLFSWYVPHSKLRYGRDINPDKERADLTTVEGWDSYYHKPWYSSRFKSIQDVADYWQTNYQDLKVRSKKFTDAFYNTTLPDFVVNAIAANLTILKSPTVLREFNGRLSCFEGCNDNRGLGAGTNTHVWNYAQAIPHLFPSLERSLRETEFLLSQDERGHQAFISSLPVRKFKHIYYAAADGQLGGIMKAYREWQISGDDEWLKKMYPYIKKSLDFCIKEWDFLETGVLDGPQHNTFDTRFWGPNGMCTGYYLGALKAFVNIGKYLNQDISRYQNILDKGKIILENDLFNEEYFIQKIQGKGMDSSNIVVFDASYKNVTYSDEAKLLISREGYMHQYGNGCLASGIIGTWMAKVCGIDQEFIDEEKVRSHVQSVYKNNFKTNLHDYVNPGRPGFAMRQEGGVINCSWPKGNKLSLPFVYSEEAWTGVEYQVASQLMFLGEIDKALDIVRVCRKRYDGSVRNPFNEYEWGHWYGRAMASYAMLQGATGIRYDAVTKTLYFDSKIGDNFTSFFSCASGFGNVGLKDGKPFVKMVEGFLDVRNCFISNKEYSFMDENPIK